MAYRVIVLDSGKWLATVQNQELPRVGETLLLVTIEGGDIIRYRYRVEGVDHWCLAPDAQGRVDLHPGPYAVLVRPDGTTEPGWYGDLMKGH